MAIWIRHIILLYLGLLVSIHASAQAAMPDTVCAGDLKHYWVDPTPGSVYTWQINGVTQSSSAHEIWVQWDLPWTPSGSPYVITVQEVSVHGCPGPVRSGQVVVRPLMPVSVTIAESENPVCPGTTVIFTATPVNGGITPVFEWRVNGILQGGNSPVFAYIPDDNDAVTCTLISSEDCPSGSPAQSNEIVMEVGPIPVSITIAASANNVCQGSLVTFTATPVNGGIMPVYQWKVNGMNQGSNSSTFTYEPANNDAVTCTLTSDIPCAVNNPATSNVIVMVIYPIPYVDLNICNPVTTREGKPFTLRGGVPPDGTYSGTGVLLGMFNPALVPLLQDTAIVSYSRINTYGCVGSKQQTITVYPAAPFTCGDPVVDVRDGRSYPTIDISGQCWLAVNLNYGQQLMSNSLQRDNCTNEKYCFNNDPANCSAYGGLYQWDEAMQYEETAAVQGLCPPGWHIPGEADWDALFALCGGNGFAGDFLRQGGLSGFDALLTGGRFMNKVWELDESAFFWSSTAHGPFKAWAHSLNSINHGASYYPSSRSNAFSVRCVRD